MAACFVNIDHDTPLMLPPNMRDWVPKDHLIHFIMDVVKELDLSSARVNHRGTGDKQYPPEMLMGLLVYSYATGIFSSRQIEKSSYENVPVRVLCADTHRQEKTAFNKFISITRRVAGTCPSIRLLIFRKFPNPFC